MKTTKAVCLGLIVAIAASVQANAQYETEASNAAVVQALLGAVQYDGLEFTSPSGTTTDMSKLPQLGGAWSTKPKAEKLSFGLEAAFLLGFKFDDVNTYTGVANTYVTASTYLWLFDISGGAYANLMLGEKLRVYGAAGPLVMISYYDSKQEYTTGVNNTSQSDTAFGFGVYARAGVELKVHEQGFLGAGVRGNWSNLDFNDVGGNSEISGIAGFLTYTVGL